ncbi:uncharacterized protein EI90DRAFT_3118498 [Cantharellus anzutake]|uniref:uncharacterized protein n=1 Tax=Cantharellus anzutake TaxID=1750568 RepID=UPI001906DCB1|nr:uncharacterized protein EI90DRAFT_3118498 [Cantharellus anzutake]KAF8338046.1 hypothetical protein EI90DRAFT_3118498 [Cantharellus anzutake]
MAKGFLKKSPPAMTPFEHLYGGYTYGLLFSAILLGIITVQSRSYFLRYPSDPVMTKLLVSRRHNSLTGILPLLLCPGPSANTNPTL